MVIDFSSILIKISKIFLYELVFKFCDDYVIIFFFIRLLSRVLYVVLLLNQTIYLVYHVITQSTLRETALPMSDYFFILPWHFFSLY